MCDVCKKDGHDCYAEAWGQTPEDEVRVNMVVKCRMVLEGSCHNTRCDHYEAHECGAECGRVVCSGTGWDTECVSCST
jgi:hypothetical protein